MSFYFTADEHYGHDNQAGGIIAMCNRPFESLEHMREEFISRHNSKVGINDTTFHLGDMFWRKLQVQDCVDIIKRLKGKHIYILGNHEEVLERSDSFLLTSRLAGISDVKMLKHNKKLVWMSHYAHRTWPKSHQGSYHVFGHTHGVLPDYRRSHDVGVDANGYAPVSFEELDALMQSKGVLPPDEVERDMLDHPWPKAEGE